VMGVLNTFRSFDDKPAANQCAGASGTIRRLP
jgi:hypothetical protein